MKLPLFIMLLAVHQGAWAYSCNSIGWNGGDADVNVNVSPDVNTDKTRLSISVRRSAAKTTL